MNKVCEFLLVCLASVIITFVVFYNMSWYSFSTLPTSIVFWRMIFSVVVITSVIEIGVYLVKKNI